jgi:hypothetical protein
MDVSLSDDIKLEGSKQRLYTHLWPLISSIEDASSIEIAQPCLPDVLGILVQTPFGVLQLAHLVRATYDVVRLAITLLDYLIRLFF